MQPSRSIVWVRVPPDGLRPSRRRGARSFSAFASYSQARRPRICAPESTRSCCGPRPISTGEQVSRTLLMPTHLNSTGEARALQHRDSRETAPSHAELPNTGASAHLVSIACPLGALICLTEKCPSTQRTENVPSRRDEARKPATSTTNYNNNNATCRTPIHQIPDFCSPRRRAAMAAPVGAERVIHDFGGASRAPARLSAPASKRSGTQLHKTPVLVDPQSARSSARSCQYTLLQAATVLSAWRGHFRWGCRRSRVHAGPSLKLMRFYLGAQDPRHPHPSQLAPYRHACAPRHASVSTNIGHKRSGAGERSSLECCRTCQQHWRGESGRSGRGGGCGDGTFAPKLTSRRATRPRHWPARHRCPRTCSHCK